MARWHTCNVLQNGAAARHLWQFDAGSFSLNREFHAAPGESFPAGCAEKSWTSLWQPKLNIAWLPADSVFLRVAHLPFSTPEETRAMVELQLEKLSPIPVTQAVWTFHVIPSAHAAAPRPDSPAAPAPAPMQTVVVTIVTREGVEEFLGRLETERFLADRIEVPVVDQLQATAIDSDGAWIYPNLGNPLTALVAWWYGGVLQNLDLLTLPSTSDAAAGVKEQLMQMAWAGELEGWLTSPPQWHLVAAGSESTQWEPALRQGLELPVRITPPLAPTALAALTARRAAGADPAVNLLPPEFTSRYRQKFFDRLWFHGLIAALGFYVVGCLVYFIAVAVLSFQTSNVEKQVTDFTPGYTNAVQIRARFAVLKDRQELKYAALDCWEAAAELMPEGLTLDSLNFTEGRRVQLSGTAPAQQVTSVIDFSGSLRKYQKQGKNLFNTSGGDPLRTQVLPGGGNVTWNFGLELNRTEEP